MLPSCLLISKRPSPQRLLLNKKTCHHHRPKPGHHHHPKAGHRRRHPSPQRRRSSGLLTRREVGGGGSSAEEGTPKSTTGAPQPGAQATLRLYCMFPGRPGLPCPKASQWRPSSQIVCVTGHQRRHLLADHGRYHTPQSPLALAFVAFHGRRL